MQRFEIDIEIAPDGEVKATVRGVKGKQCGLLSQFLDALGNVTHDGDTPEALQREDQSLGTRLGTRQRKG